MKAQENDLQAEQNTGPMDRADFPRRHTSFVRPPQPSHPNLMAESTPAAGRGGRQRNQLAAAGVLEPKTPRGRMGGSLRTSRLVQNYQVSYGGLLPSTNSANAASLSTATPNAFALANLLPAFSPATR